MDDVNEWSTEYNVKVGSFSNLPESPHSWDKRVLNITPIESGRNYRFRLGLQMFRMKTNESYSLVIELYNRDYETWQRQKTYVNVTGMWLETFNTKKYQYHYDSSGGLYYTKSLLTFRKTSSSPPLFIYFTVHFHDNAGDLNTYPKEYKNQVYIVYIGIKGLSDHVDPEVYDAHEAFEIDKAKMKMLVPLDMNGKQLLNMNYGAFALEQNKMKMLLPLDMNGQQLMNFNLKLKFGDIFKIIKCYTKLSSDGRFFLLARKDNRQTLTFTDPVIINSITFHNKQTFHKDATVYFSVRGIANSHSFKLINLVDSSLIRNLSPWLEFSSGLRFIRLTNLINNIRLLLMLMHSILHVIYP